VGDIVGTSSVSAKPGANARTGHKAEDDSNPRSALPNLLATNPLHHGINRFVTASRYRPPDRILAFLNTLQLFRQLRTH
jgi:hypothetical protein